MAPAHQPVPGLLREPARRPDCLSAGVSDSVTEALPALGITVVPRYFLPREVPASASTECPLRRALRVAAGSRGA